MIYVRDVPEPTPFDGPILKGFAAAGKQLGDDTVFEGAPANTTASNPAEEQRLIQDAIAEKPACLIVTFDTPSAESAGVAQAEHAGIPVVFSDAGYQDATKYGALTYVGSDETLVGQVGAQRLNGLGAKHALVITLASGALPLTDQRSAGFKASFNGQITWLYLSLAQATGSVSTVAGLIQAELTKTPGIDSVFSAGVAFTPAELAAEAAIGSQAKNVKWATADTDAQIIGAIKDGQITFALDQQQYLQGYWSALVCDQYVRYGLTPADPVMATGPVVVNSSNLSIYEKAQAAGVR